VVFKRVDIDSREVESGYFNVSELILFAVQNFKGVHHIFKVSGDKVKLANGLDGIWKLRENLKPNFIVDRHFLKQGLKSLQVSVIKFHVLVLMLICHF
jgi:hypothetical protein